MHSFTFDGVNSRDYCELFVSGGGAFNAPERDIESVSVPGRNGDLTLDNGRYKNIKVEYNAWIAKDFPENAAKARAWLCAGMGQYKRLEDDYNPLEFRMARFIDGLNVDGFSSFGDYLAGTMTITFDCMPQRFLKSGENVITFSDAGGGGQYHAVINPTNEDAYPLIEIYNGGDTFPAFDMVSNGGRVSRILQYVPDQNYSYADDYKYLLIDCDKQIIYHKKYESDPWNFRNVGVSITGQFPIFYGKVESSFYTTNLNSGRTYKVTPRWWTI